MILALLAAGALAAGSPTPTPSKAEREVRAVLADQASAWSRGDIDAFCAVYAEDATFVSPSGVSSGRQTILERYKKKYPGKAGMGSLTFEVLEARDLGAGGMSVVGRWTLAWPDNPGATGSSLLVLRARKGGGWEIVQDASM